MEKLPQKKIASEINVILLILIRKWKKNLLFIFINICIQNKLGDLLVAKNLEVFFSICYAF